MRIEPNAASMEYTNVLEHVAPKSSRPSEFEQPSSSDAASFPLITIGIPTRNRASLVADAVKRALAQSYSNIEVLVSDNASTDNTLATLRSITDPRLRILTSPEDIGHSANYFKCIREAKGEYLLLVPDDDRISETFIEKCVNLLHAEPGIRAVVAAHSAFFADENRDRRAITSKRLSTGIWDGPEILNEFLRGEFSPIMLSTIFRPELLRGKGLWPSEYQFAADILALSRILISGRAGLLNEPVATLTIHGSSVSSRLGLDHCFRETQEVMAIISDTANRAIPDEASRRELQALTQQYVAKKLFDFLVLYRRQGAELREVARQLRIWRKQSRQCTLIHFVAALRLKTLALLLFPAPFTKFLLSLRHAVLGRGQSPVT